MNICEHLATTARLFPEHEAIRFENRSLSYGHLQQQAAVAAAVLAASGVGKGDRVALLLPNVPAFAVWYYATLRLGAIAVSISTRLTPPEVRFILEDCQALLLVSDTELLGGLSGDLPACVLSTQTVNELGDPVDQQNPTDPAGSADCVDCDPDDAALILYTSGTTGFAKGATLSHRNVRSNVHAFNHLCGMNPAQRILLAVPLFHCFGQNALLNSALHAGSTLVLQRRFDLAETKRLIRDHRITQLYGVPMMFQLLLESCEPDDLASVNYCFSAAATLPIQISEQWLAKYGMPIHEGYGLTESSPFASYNHRLKYIPGSIGTPIDLVEMRIIDTETGQPCAAGQLGEIAIRGPNVMLGYWNRPADTAKAIREGWLHSGDIGRVDDKGYFYIVDRVKDMIVVGGLKVYPAEVERVLMDCHEIDDVAVVGLADDLTGERVAAFVVLSGKANGSAIDQIRKHAEANLARYKLPTTIVPIEQLPRNPSGKVLKTQLREYSVSKTPSAAEEQITQQAGFAQTQCVAPTEPVLRMQLLQAHPATRVEIATRFLCELAQSIMQSEQLPDAESGILDSGLDSLAAVEMARQLKVAIGSAEELPATLVFDHPRFSDFARFLVEHFVDGDGVTKVAVTENEAKNQRLRIEAMMEDEATAELIRELES